MNNGAFGGAFSGIIRASMESIPVVDGDYQKDGLWYCGQCNEPKQCRITIMGVEEKPMCLCRCAQERNAKEEERRRRESFEAKVKELRKIGFSDRDLAKCVFENDDLANPGVTEIATKYVANFKKLYVAGKGLLFYGNVGVGKTFYAACIANALVNKGVPCIVTSFTKAINTICASLEGKQEYLDGLNRFGLVVLDDLAAERNTEYTNEVVYSIIDSRYRSGKPLIITTNLSAQELFSPTEMSKQRIYSRILEMCVPVKVEGKDRRKEKAKEQNSEIKKMLGL